MTLEESIQFRINRTTSLNELVLILKYLLTYHSIWTDGSLYFIKALVESVDGLRIEIYHSEHPPPHFHVKANGINAAFTILDCKLIKGEISGREKMLVEWWYERSKSKLIKFWNDSRPSDCSVGPINEE
jgi:Domain of unknown function (DUF4160)